MSGSPLYFTDPAPDISTSSISVAKTLAEAAPLISMFTSSARNPNALKSPAPEILRETSFTRPFKSQSAAPLTSRRNRSAITSMFKSIAPLQSISRDLTSIGVSPLTSRAPLSSILCRSVYLMCKSFFLARKILRLLSISSLFPT